jgi:hypothetical protein
MYHHPEYRPNVIAMAFSAYFVLTDARTYRTPG